MKNRIIKNIQERLIKLDWLISLNLILFIISFFSFNNILIGQEFIERNISNITFSPNYIEDHTIFICVWGSGLYKSEDNGNTWDKIDVSSDSDKYFIGFAFSPAYNQDSTIFVGSEKLYRSKNKGVNWENLWQFGGSCLITDISMSPNIINDQTVYVATYGGSVKRNTAGGDGWWEQMHTEHFFDWCVTLSPNFSNDSTLFVGTAGGGIKASTDRGDSWEHASSDDPHWGASVRSIRIPEEFEQNKKVFAATDDKGVLKSENAGSSWFSINNGLTNSFCTTLTLSPDFESDHSMFVGSADGIFKSNNEGETWLPSSNGMTTPYIYSISTSPNYSVDQTVFAGTDEGLFKSSDAGVSWNHMNSDLEVSTIPNITKSPFIFDVQPSISIGSDGGLHIAWLGLYASFGTPDGVVEDVFYLKKENGIWSKPIKISVPTGYYSKNISLSVDKLGHPHIVFRRSTDQSQSLSEDDIFYTNNTGAGFLEPVKVIDGGYYNDWLRNPLEPSLALDSNGVAHIVYLAGYTGNLWYTNNHNGSFITPIKIINDDTRALGVDISSDGNGKIHVAVEAVYPGVNTQTEIYYTNNLSGNFSSLQKLSSDGGDTPIITIDSQDKVHIAFYRISSGWKQVGYINNKAGSFSNPQYLMGYHHPSMTLDSYGNVHIAAQQQSGSPWGMFVNQIAYANNIGGQFINRPITRLTSGVATAQKRYIAVSPDDSIHIVFANSTLGGYDISHLCFPSNSSMFEPPVADFLVDRARGASGLRVSFTDLSQGYVASRMWNFGDGQTSTNENPNHTYYSDSLRTYTVSLIIEGCGSDSISKVNYITVTGDNHAPILSDNTIDPTIGNLNTEFVYSVTYSDFDGDPPEHAHIGIDGSSWQDMEKISGDCLVGAVYQYTTKLCEGEHNYWFQFVDSDGYHWVLSPASGKFTGPSVLTTAVHTINSGNLPKEINLYHNFPNPFNSSTTINYQIPKLSHIKIQIFNISGQLIRILQDSKQLPGYYTIIWDGRDDFNKSLPSGIYFCKFNADNYNKVIKLSVLK